MKIRAVTLFTEIYAQDAETPLARAATFLAAARHAFKHAGIAVESQRVATQPFPKMEPRHGPAALPDLAARLREAATSYGIGYLSLGPVGMSDDPDYVDSIVGILRKSDGVFASVEIANHEQDIDLGLLRHAARLIRETSTIADDGLTNLYLAAIANCGPGSPFFPAAYHDGGPARFALAIEGADLVIDAFKAATTPADARQRLTARINEIGQKLCAIAERLSAEHGVIFGGLDFSLAPYPGDATSLGAGMEALGVQVGGAGAVAAAALVMNAVEAADIPRCGFSGLMLPVLEDSIIARRIADGTLHLNDLLLYSAVCGTGLDCIPLPGDVSEDVLTGILLDVAALSLRLDKPLTARLMPLPGKVAGDEVSFPDYEYFVPSRVMSPPAGISGGAFDTSAALNIRPRPRQALVKDANG